MNTTITKTKIKLTSKEFRYGDNVQRAEVLVELLLFVSNKALPTFE